MPTLSDEVRASYYDWALRGQLFVAYATVTAPVIYSTAAATGGPLLWNGTGIATATASKKVNAVLLALGMGVSVASTVSTSLGITGGAGQVAAPSSTTAIDGSGSTLIGAAGPRCNVYRIGTVTNAGAFFQPTHAIGTGAITVPVLTLTWTDLGGSIVVPPGSWASVAAAATATTAVLSIGLLWAEIPL